MRMLTEFQLQILDLDIDYNNLLKPRTAPRGKVKYKIRTNKETPATKAFRKQHNYYGRISLKEMGKELWNEFQKMYYKYKKSTNLINNS